jgi:hypothetical protein
MINAGTAVLLALLMHLGGVDIDEARDARLISYRDSIPTAEWRLTAHDTGTYRFVGEEGAGVLIVERLRGAGVVYTVLQYEQRGHAPSAADPPELRRPVAIGTVSLDGVAAGLRRPRPGVTFSPDREDIAVAWMEPGDTPAPPEDTAANGVATPQPSSRDGGDPDSRSPDGGTPDGAGLSVSVQSSRLSASDPATSQVLILSLR